MFEVDTIKQTETKEKTREYVCIYHILQLDELKKYFRFLQLEFWKYFWLWELDEL